MTIFHIITHFDQGGAEVVALNISKSRNCGFNYHIVEVAKTKGTFRDYFLHECKDNKICIHTSPVTSKKLAIVFFPFWFLFVVLKYKPQIIHTHTEIPDLATYLWHTIFGGLFPGVKYVRTIHNTELWNEWKFIGKKVEPFYEKKHANVAISLSTQRYYQKAYGDSPSIIYNGIGIPIPKRFSAIVPCKINILFAGRLEYQKGVDELVHIIKLLKEDDRFIFHVVGDGSLKERLNSIKHYDNVLLYDKIFGLPSYLSSFDYLFMPSNFEGLGLLSIEASFSKTPTIINKCPGLIETLPTDWILSVENNSIEDYLNIFRTIDTFDRKSLGEKAYEYVSAHFSIEKMQSEYESLYLQK